MIPPATPEHRCRYPFLYHSISRNDHDQNILCHICCSICRCRFRTLSSGPANPDCHQRPQPALIRHRAQRDSRLFIVEQGGLIKILQNGTALPTPFLDLSNAVNTSGERGLLGMAFDPDFADNRRFYVNYIDRTYLPIGFLAIPRNTAMRSPREIWRVPPADVR